MKAFKFNEVELQHYSFFSNSWDHILIYFPEAGSLTYEVILKIKKFDTPSRLVRRKGNRLWPKIHKKSECDRTPSPLLADFICERSLSYHLESLQIIDKFYFKSLGIFLNMANIFMPGHKKWKDFSSSSNFYHHD